MYSAECVCYFSDWLDCHAVINVKERCQKFISKYENSVNNFVNIVMLCECT